MKQVIFDASPLIFFSKANLLGVLKRMYKKVFVASTVMCEIEKPIELGYKAPEVNSLKSSGILSVESLNAKEIIEAKKISDKYNIGKGEAESAILFKRGGFDVVIVADIRAERKLRDFGVNVLDLVDFGFVVAKRGIMNPREFSLRLYEKAHYRTQRIRDILGRR